jgi:hypothetical protein
MDLADIRNEVSRVIGLDTTAAGADETLVDQWANEAVLDILLETRCHIALATTTTTANQGDYDLDVDILHVVDLYDTSSSNRYRLQQVSPARLLDMRVTSNAQATAPVTHFAVAGSNLLMLYPIPSGTDTLTIYYVPRPTAMSTGTDDPSDAANGGIPAEFHRAIVKYVEAEAADYRDDQTSQHGDRYRADYARWLGKIRKAVNQKGNTDTPAFEIRGRSYPPHDPSTDIRC